MAVSLLFQEMEDDRPSLNPFYFLENFFSLVPMYSVTNNCVHSICVVTSCGGV